MNPWLLIVRNHRGRIAWTLSDSSTDVCISILDANGVVFAVLQLVTVAEAILVDMPSNLSTHWILKPDDNICVVQVHMKWQDSVKYEWVAQTCKYLTAATLLKPASYKCGDSTLIFQISICIGKYAPYLHISGIRSDHICRNELLACVPHSVFAHSSALWCDCIMVHAVHTEGTDRLWKVVTMCLWVYEICVFSFEFARVNIKLDYAQRQTNLQRVFFTNKFTVVLWSRTPSWENIWVAACTLMQASP